MARQEKFKHKKLHYVSTKPPPLCIVCLHYSLNKPPHWQKYLLNHKEQHSPSTKTTP